MRRRAVGYLAAGLLSLGGCSSSGGGASWQIHKNLSHTAVERYIETSSSFGYPVNVVCNGGKDIKVTNGKTFACVAADASKFNVRITKAEDAEYVVTPGP